jgi:hypothetical protein
MKCRSIHKGYTSANIIFYVLFMFVLAIFLSNTALISLLEDDNHPILDMYLPAIDSGTSGIQNIRRSDKNGNNNLLKPRPRVAPVSLPPYGSCAILLFGLPRAFRQYVLPSLVKNVVRPNLPYGCDYFVHYYHIEKEVSNGRSGRGGAIYPDDINLLRQAVAEAYQNRTENAELSSSPIGPVPRVFIDFDTNESFWEKRQSQLMKYRNARNTNGTLTYFPYTEPTYVYPDTIDNIVKQWHSIDAVWNLMEQEQKTKSQGYQQVATMRSDVIYITPVDIYATPNDATVGDSGSKMVIIPNFAKFPINDRMIIGPYDAVKLWATERFHRIDHYATKVAAPGTAMHSETFLNDTILTSIRSDLHLQIYEDPWLCFLRVRADGAIWIEDCDAAKSGYGGGFPGRVMSHLKPFLNQNATCRHRWLRDPVRRIKELICKNDRISTDAVVAAREMMIQSRLRIK